MFLTQVLKINGSSPEAEVLQQAAAILRSGRLVAFPTETVYGLGANALDVAAVKKIYEAKGRPSNNPLIVHVSDASAAQEFVRVWPEAASRLAAAFWPGPLTLVLPKSDKIPSIVSAGGDTVALRVPNHPVALALLNVARLPIAAPSANRSTEVSPTSAAHVLKSLDGRIEWILDGGPCQGGLESTVLDLSGNHTQTSLPRLLRPGLISVAQIEAVLGRIRIESQPLTLQSSSMSAPMPSPGLQHRHYAPRAMLEVACGSGVERVERLLNDNRRVGWLILAGAKDSLDVKKLKNNKVLKIIEIPSDPVGYGSNLYSALHRLDDEQVEHIVIAEFPKSEAWLAIADRLKRAARGTADRKD